MRRVLDPGAVFAGWVGVGIAVLIVISFELVVAVQSLVFIVAPVAGFAVGYYANARSARRRPWWRVFTNAAYAGLVTAVSLAVFYGAIRLLFVYADNGYPSFNVPGQQSCATGPECTFQRYVREGRGGELASLGVSDGKTFERYVLREQVNGALTLVAYTFAAALVGGAVYGVRRQRAVAPASLGVSEGAVSRPG